MWKKLFGRSANPEHLRETMENGIVRKNIDWVREALDKGLDPNDQQGLWLEKASFSGNSEAVKELLKRGAQAAKCKESPLFTSIQQSLSNPAGHLDVVKLLVESGVDIEARDKNYGCSALVYTAAFTPRIDILDYLLSCNPDVNSQDNNGRTALVHALLDGKKEMAQKLIYRGANVYMASTYGEVPLDLAEEKGFTDIADLIRQKQGQAAPYSGPGTPANG